MRRAAGGSWRFAHGVEQLPHALLYVRDALGLAIEPALGVPPSLSVAPPDRSGLLEPAARTDAAREWATWWRTLVDYESRRHLDTGDNIEATHDRFLEYHRAVRPDTSAALADTALQAPAVALFDEGCDWAGTLRTDIRTPQDLASNPQAFTWALVRDSVEAVAVTCGVDVRTRWCSVDPPRGRRLVGPCGPRLRSLLVDCRQQSGRGCGDPAQRLRVRAQPRLTLTSTKSIRCAAERHAG
jgi:hypothetical protein